MTTNPLKRISTEDDGTVSPPPLKRGKPSVTTNKVVANFFTKTSEKEKIPERVTWRVQQESLIVGRSDEASGPAPPKPAGEGSRLKVAGFDFDSTLISTASGSLHSNDANDWRWWDASVPLKLRSLHADGYALAVFSNQSGISLKSDSKTFKTDKKRFADFKTKAAAVFAVLDVPISIYAATAKDAFRKPRTGMWEAFLADHGLDPGSVDLERSVFVGDAGGRAAGSQGRRKDFACSDRDFAANVGIAFHTPEEFFLGQEVQPFTREFDPAAYVVGEQELASTDSGPVVFTKKNELDLTIFCGSPGAGKSTFYWRYLQPLGYERVNQDILKSRGRCLKVAAAFLEEGTSVAVDNTNADVDTRRDWVSLARKFKVPIRCVHFTASTRLAEHNDAVRALNGSSTNPEKRSLLPKMAFAGFASRYQQPGLEEGFQDIIKVDFKFEGTEEEKAVWKKFWL